MDPNNVPITAPGGRPRPPLATRRPLLSQRRMRALRARLNTTNSISDAFSNLVADIPEPEEKKTRVYTLEDFVDAETIEAALANHLARAQAESPTTFSSSNIVCFKSVTFIGFTGKASHVLSQQDVVYFALADKSRSIATQLYKALEISPVPLTIALNLTPGTEFITINNLETTTTAECESAVKEDREKFGAPFNFRKLPTEVRKMIYLCSDLFALRHDGQIPAFYQATLCNKSLRDEATDAYKQVNYHLTLANEPEFNKLKIHESKSFNHMYFQWGDLGMEQYKHRYLQLRANRCQIMNNFRTLTMDFSTVEPCNFSLMQNISRASSGVYRLNVRLQPFAQLATKKIRCSAEGDDLAWGRLRLIQFANEWIRTPGRLTTVGPADVNEEWFWERDDRQFLDLGPVGMARPKEPPVKGNMSLEDRVDRRSIFCR